MSLNFRQWLAKLIWSVWHFTGFLRKQHSGIKSLILFYIHLLSLHFPQTLGHDWNIVRRPVLYTTDLSGTELLQTHRTSSVFKFLGIRWEVTLENFPETSRPLEWPLPNSIMKLFVFPYLFMKAVSQMSNCLSLRPCFSILWISPRYQGFARSSHIHRNCWRN